MRCLCQADAFTSTQEVLAKEKDDRKVEVERLEGERTNLLKEKLDNEASIKELNEKLASKDASIAELETHVGEVRFTGSIGTNSYRCDSVMAQDSISQLNNVFHNAMQ